MGTASGTTLLVFVAMPPCRVVDTRSGMGFNGDFGPPTLAGGTRRTFPIQSSTTCVIPSIALAYSFNITVVPPGPLLYITVYPTGQQQPNASTLNSPQGFIIANAAIVPAGSSGSVDVFVSNPTDVIIDINGYYAAVGDLNTNTALGNQSFVNNTTGGFNTAFGAQTLENNTTGSGNTAVGTQSLQNNTTGGSNTAYGFNALRNNTSGPSNTATGANALESNTTGGANTASGSYALNSNTTGNANTATGEDALQNNTSGGSNTASGYYALNGNTTGSSNTADGVEALQNNTIGDSNTAFGARSLNGNTTGYSNTALGVGALSTNTTGNNNIAIGSGAAFNVSASRSNNIHIGSQGTTGDSGTIRIGTPATQNSFYAAGVRGITTSSNDVVPVVIDSNGQLGTVNSARRFKEDIQDMGEASHRLLNLRPVTFRYKKPFADGSQPMEFGLIAEDVAEVFPELVAHSADGQIESIKYQMLDSLLLNELQKQLKAMHDLAAQNRELETRVATLELILSQKQTTQTTP